MGGFYSFGEKELATMRDDYARRNLAVPAVCPTHVTLSDPDLAKKNAPRVEKAIDVAAFMGCNMINLSLVQTVPPRSSLAPTPTSGTMRSSRQRCGNWPTGRASRA
jgi:sugar phosphate isomerase/epimerase